MHQKLKYLGMNLTKEVKEPYLDSYETRKKETAEGTDKGTHPLCSRIRKNGRRCHVRTPKATYRFDATPILIPMTHFTELEPIIPRFLWDHERSQIATAIPREDRVGGITLPNDK